MFRLTKADFAQTLHILMDRDNITQAALASALGLTSSAVSLWCTGKAYPDVAMLIKLAEYFDVTTDYLLTGNQSSGKDIGISESAAEHLRAAMRGDYGDISPVIEFLLKSKDFYESLDHCVQGFLSRTPRAAILMCSNGMFQVIDSEVRVGKDDNEGTESTLDDSQPVPSDN